MPGQSVSPNPCPQQSQSQTGLTCCQNVFLQRQVSCCWFWFWCAVSCWGQAFACVLFLSRLRVKPEAQSRHNISNSNFAEVSARLRPRFEVKPSSQPVRRSCTKPTRVLPKSVRTGPHRNLEAKPCCPKKCNLGFPSFYSRGL